MFKVWKNVSIQRHPTWECAAAKVFVFPMELFFTAAISVIAVKVMKRSIVRNLIPAAKV